MVLSCGYRVHGFESTGYQVSRVRGTSEGHSILRF